MILADEQTLLEATAVLKALSDLNRLRIFTTLMDGDSCNQELQEALGLSPNLLSHHLRILSPGWIDQLTAGCDGRPLDLLLSESGNGPCAGRRGSTDFSTQPALRNAHSADPKGSLTPVERLYKLPQND